MITLVNLPSVSIEKLTSESDVYVFLQREISSGIQGTPPT